MGYNFVNIDDCWAEKNRTAAGDIIEGLLNRYPQGCFLTDAALSSRSSSLQEWYEVAQPTNSCTRIVSQIRFLEFPILMSYLFLVKLALLAQLISDLTALF